VVGDMGVSGQGRCRHGVDWEAVGAGEGAGCAGALACGWGLGMGKYKGPR